MLKQQTLLEMERALELDDEGVCEDYFPTWGYSDPEQFLKEADKHRSKVLQQERELQEQRRLAEEKAQEQKLAQECQSNKDSQYMSDMAQALRLLAEIQKEKQVAENVAADEATDRGAQDASGEGLSANASLSSSAKEGEQQAVPAKTAAVPLGVRVVYGVGYWVRHVFVALLVIFVSSIVFTYFLNVQTQADWTIGDAANLLVDNLVAALEEILPKH